jgi:hypothetical protein
MTVQMFDFVTLQLTLDVTFEHRPSIHGFRKLKDRVKDKNFCLRLLKQQKQRQHLSNWCL